MLYCITRCLKRKFIFRYSLRSNTVRPFIIAGYVNFSTTDFVQRYPSTVVLYLTLPVKL